MFIHILYFILTIIGIAKSAAVNLPYIGNINIVNVDDVFQCDELECDSLSTKCTVALTTDVTASLRTYEATCWIEDNVAGNSKIRHEKIENANHNESLVMEFSRHGSSINIHGNIDGNNINLQLGSKGWLKGDGNGIGWKLTSFNIFRMFIPFLIVTVLKDVLVLN